MEIIIECNEKRLKVSKFIIKDKSGVRVYTKNLAVKLARVYTSNEDLFNLWLHFEKK